MCLPSHQKFIHQTLPFLPFFAFLYSDISLLLYCFARCLPSAILCDAPRWRTRGTNDHIHASGPKDLTTSRADPNPVGVVEVLAQNRGYAILHGGLVPRTCGID